MPPPPPIPFLAGFALATYEVIPLYRPRWVRKFSAKALKVGYPDSISCRLVYCSPERI